MKEYIVDGVEFNTQEEYEMASRDLRNITSVRAVLDIADIKSVLKVYNRAIDQNIFKTLVGISFLKELQDILIIDGGIPPRRLKAISQVVPLEAVETNANELENLAEEEGYYHFKNEQWLFRSLLINGVLVIVIVIMFFVAYNSKNLNIINYQRISNNKYNVTKDLNGDNNQTTDSNLNQNE